MTWLSRAGTVGACLASIAPALPARAHTIVGDRVFPATLTIDDPGVNDELALPAFSYLTAENPDGTTGPSAYTIGFEYAKRITADLQISVGSDGVTFQRNPRATGFANIETGLKYVFVRDATAEFIVAGGVSVEIGHTGSGPTSALPADPFSTVTLKGYAGKGFGSASADWLRPFAVTAEVDASFPTLGRNPIDQGQNPTILTYGGTIQYSLLYRNGFVEEVPDVFKRLIPAVEGIFSTPIANVGPDMAGAFSARDTTGVVGPSVYYIGQYFELGVMAQVPINAASGKHPGVIAVVDFFLDDIAPETIGKPLFGPAAAHQPLSY